jgi:hypothetical protein
MNTIEKLPINDQPHSDESCQAKQISDDQLTPEELAKRREYEAHHLKEESYDNSWKKNEDAGFGFPKFRVANEETNFSNLKVDYINWDFTMNGRSYQVVRIPGYPHGEGNYCDWYCYDIKYGHDPEKYKGHLIPFDKRWEPCQWSYTFEPITSYRVKWDEYRTNSGYIGTLLRNGKKFLTVNYITLEDTYVALRMKKMAIDMHPLNLMDRDWEQKCIGRKVKYNNTICEIENVFAYDGVSFYIKPIKDTIPPNGMWDNDDKDSICNRERWKEYSSGLNVEFDNPHVNWII